MTPIQHALSSESFMPHGMGCVLEQREADIAIRYARPAHGASAMRKMGELGSAAYAHKSLLQSRADWQKELPWIGFAKWPTTGRSSSGLLQMCRVSTS